MAELIDKEALLSLVNREKEMSSSEYSVGYIDAINDVNNMIDVLPTTTEAEIRAKAIDEFAEAIKNAYASMKSVSDVERATANTIAMGVAEQLKEE